MIYISVRNDFTHVKARIYVQSYMYPRTNSQKYAYTRDAWKIMGERNICRMGEGGWEREILGTQFYKILNRPARRHLTRPRVTWLLYWNLLLIKRKLLRYIYITIITTTAATTTTIITITTITITTITMTTTTTTTITTTIIAIYRYLYIYNCVVWSGTLWYNRLVLTPYWNWDKFNEK